MRAAKVQHDVPRCGQTGNAVIADLVRMLANAMHRNPCRNSHAGAQRDNNDKADGDAFSNSPVFHGLIFVVFKLMNPTLA